MGAYMVLSEISLKKCKDINNAHIIYASLIDFFGDTKNDLKNLVSFFMENSHMFNFSKHKEDYGLYNGDNGLYKGKYFTFSDGDEYTNFILRVLKILYEYSELYKNSVKLIVHEDYILEKDVINFSLDAALSESIAKTVVRLYIKKLKELVDQGGLSKIVEFIFNTDIEYPLQVSYRAGKVIVYKSNRYQDRLNSKQKQKGSLNMNNVGSLVKVNKTKARMLYEKGAIIMILPCKIALNNIYIQPVEVSNKSNLPFDSIVNEFEYYNCSCATGGYASYYVDSSCV